MNCIVSYSFKLKEIDRKWIASSIRAQDWGTKRSPQDIEYALNKSLICGAFDQNRPVGFIRAITDERFFGYIGDLFVTEEYRGQGIAAELLATLINHPRCSQVVNWMVTTRNAGLYFERFGFKQAHTNANLFAQGQVIAQRLAALS
jgi:N-acetylglutamate synthase-like GNAT family acetyltransferase